MNLKALFGQDAPEFPVLLAPMAGITDMTFRGICREMGCDFTYTEMVSAKGLSYGNARTRELLSIAENERPCGVQLFGSDPAVMANTARAVSAEYSDALSLIDINMGCPAKKITGSGDGCALMKNVPLASRVIEAVVNASSLPVTVKFRKGWDENSVNALPFARMAEESGAAAITVHGRTRMQMYAGKADWDIIAAVKASVAIPVIGNGDVFSGEDARRLRSRTGCDGVMVARGAEGNPFIFPEIKAALAGQSYAKPTDPTRIDMAIEHLLRYAKTKDGYIAGMRKTLAWYLRGLPHSAEVKRRAFALATLGELLDLLQEYRRTLALDKE